MPTQRFADVQWQERWNNSEQVALLSQSGPSVDLTTVIGVLHFSLEGESAEAIANAFEQTATLIRNTKEDYDNG